MIKRMSTNFIHNLALILVFKKQIKKKRKQKMYPNQHLTIKILIVYLEKDQKPKGEERQGDRIQVSELGFSASQLTKLWHLMSCVSKRKENINLFIHHKKLGT